MAVGPNTHGYTVGWFTLALINAGLAQCKGRGGGTWFLISVVLGPLATFLLVIMKPGSGPDQDDREFDLDRFRKQ